MSQLFDSMFNGKINNKFLKYYPNFKNLIAVSAFQLKISGTNSIIYTALCLKSTGQ